jgi:hypothetical protein
MNSSDLKINLFRQIDALDTKSLKEIYGVFMNYMNNKKDDLEWNSLSEEEKSGIMDAIHSLDNNQGKLHEDVLSTFRKKYE